MGKVISCVFVPFVIVFTSSIGANSQIYRKSADNIAEGLEIDNAKNDSGCAHRIPCCDQQNWC